MRDAAHSMDADDVDAMNASVSWFDENSFDAEGLQVQSLDFGLLTGDVVPRDGLQRPLLTSGSPTSAPVAKRASQLPMARVSRNSFRNLGAFFRGKSFSKFGYVFSVSRFLQVSRDLEVS